MELTIRIYSFFTAIKPKQKQCLIFFKEQGRSMKKQKKTSRKLAEKNCGRIKKYQELLCLDSEV